MRLERRIRVGIVALGIAILLLQPTAAWPRGWAQIMSDEELDRVFAQGFVVVNIAFQLANVGGRFNMTFKSVTAIDVPDQAQAGASVDLLGGAVSIAAGAAAASQPSTSATGVTASASGPSPPGASQTGGGLTTPVKITFGAGSGSSGSGGAVLGINSIGARVNSRVDIRLERVGVSRSVIRAVRSSLGGSP